MGIRSNNNLVITGTANSAGGRYEQVKITGEGVIGGDLECATMKVTGTAEVNGHAKADTVTIMGNSHISGSLTAGKASILGDAVFGELKVKEFSCNGVALVQGDAHGEDMKIRGVFKVKGSCQAETFKSLGSFVIGGLLNAGRIDVVLHGESQAKEIGGETIHVRRWSMINLVKKWFGGVLPHRLTADSIEGDDIRLEHTTAKVVRGSRVILGPGCRVDLVEYIDSFDQHNGATVLEHRQIKIGMERN